MISRLAAFLGFPSAALLGWSILAALAVAAAGSVATGIMVHRYDTALHGKAVAEMQAKAATTLAEANLRTLEAERAGAARAAQLEADYVHLSQDRDRLQADLAERSGALAAALDRLRGTPAHRGGGDGLVPQPAGSPGGCEDVRAALDRALGAVDLLRRGGDQVARLGQIAVDVATVAAAAAKGEKGAAP